MHSPMTQHNTEKSLKGVSRTNRNERDRVGGSEINSLEEMSRANNEEHQTHKLVPHNISDPYSETLS